MNLRPTLAVLTLGALLAADAVAAPMETRVFLLRWRSVEDAAYLVRELLSEDARTQIEPKLRVLTITDRPGNLEQVAQAIATFDVPPRTVDVTITLVRATKAASPRPIAEQLKSVRDSVEQVVPYTDYEVLGEARLSGVEGADLATVLGGKGEYRVAFRVGTADDRNGVVRFDGLALDRKRSREGRFDNLMTLTYNAQTGKKVVLGATQAKDPETGVLLVMEAVIVPDGKRDAYVAGGKGKP